MRFIDQAGKRIAQHDSKGDHANPAWDDVYPLEETDGKTLARCRIVAHADEWEVGVTEGGRVLLGAGEGRIYSLPPDQAEKIADLLPSAILEAKALWEKKGTGRGLDEHIS